MLQIELRYEAALGHREQRHGVAIIGFHAAHDHALHVLRSVGDLIDDFAQVDALREGGGVGQRRNRLRQVLGIVETEIFARADVGRQTRKSGVAGRNTQNEKSLRTKVADASFDVSVQPVDDGGHGYHRSDTDDDAEDSQPGAHLPRPEGVQGYQQILFDFGTGHLEPQMDTDDTDKTGSLYALSVS